MNNANTKPMAKALRQTVRKLRDNFNRYPTDANWRQFTAASAELSRVEQGEL